MRATPDLFAGPIGCDGCRHIIWWPRWLPNGSGGYWCLCERCHYQIDLHFTPEAAIHEAMRIVGSGVLL